MDDDGMMGEGDMVECVTGDTRYGLTKGALYTLTGVWWGGHRCANDGCGYVFVSIDGPMPDAPSLGWCPNRFAKRSSRKEKEKLVNFLRTPAPGVTPGVRIPEKVE